MQIIPVIDLQGGQVVHAVRGERSAYQPIHRYSRLTHSSELEQVVSDFLAFYPFPVFYIADLDAIQGFGDNTSPIDKLCQRYPNIEFWLDNGTQWPQTNSRMANQIVVIGTESQCTPLTKHANDFILSLDFKDQALGHSDWFDNSQLWPCSVIVMTLSRVGSHQGPDFEKLRQLSTRHPETRWIAAGGVRDLIDLERLADLGMASVLIASALHAGRLCADDIAKFQAKKYPGKPRYFYDLTC